MGRTAVVLAAALTIGCGGAVKLVTGGDSHELRKRLEGAPASSPNHPGLLVLCFDGVDRSLLYDMLRKGEMPALAELLGGSASATFPHAYFDDTLLSTLPSSTMAAWVTTCLLYTSRCV